MSLTCFQHTHYKPRTQAAWEEKDVFPRSLDIKANTLCIHTHTMHSHTHTQFREERTYIISTKTGSMRGAGTDANVFITLFGSEGSSGERRLDNDVANFERGRQVETTFSPSSILPYLPPSVHPSPPPSSSSPSLPHFLPSSLHSPSALSSSSSSSLPSPYPSSPPHPPFSLLSFIFLQTRSLPDEVCGCGSCR